MSGSTIGGIVGGTIGFFFGNPQLGWMLGSAIGGYVDPDQIHGPRLNDAQVQTSQEGVPRPIVYGTAVVAGNLIQRGPLIERKKKERAGKGGPEQVTYHYYMSYAIRVCEGPVAGIRRIWRDDKLVYSTVEGDDLDAESGAFASKLTIYLGGESQLPDPTLEALGAEYGGGVGNVPSYRGSCYVVFENDDLTERRGTIPQYRFEVATSATTTTSLTEAGLMGWWPLDDAVAGGTAREVIGNKTGTYSAGVTAGPSLLAGSGSSAYFDAFGEHMVVTGYPLTSVKDLDNWSVSCWCQPTTTSGGSVHKSAAGYQTANFFGGSKSWELVLRDNADNMTPVGAYGAVGFNDHVRLDASSAASVNQKLFMVMTREKNAGDNLGTVKLYVNGVLEAQLDNQGVPNNTGQFIVAGGGYQYSSSYQFLGYVQHIKQYNVVLTAAQVLDRYRNADDYNVLPDTPSSYTTDGGSLYTPSATRVAVDAVSLSSIVSDICDRVGIESSQLDVSALTDSVTGYVVGRQMSASDAIRPLQQAYFFDLPEWDKKLRGVKRGGASVVTLTDDDFVESDADEETRAQAVEFPRKFNLIAPDPDANYAPTKATAERRSDNVQAVGEQTLELAVVLGADEKAQIADKQLKVAWASAEGRIVRQLPEAFTYLTPSDAFTYNDKRWRIDRAEYLEGSVKIEATRDRISAYSSSATGATTVAPTSPSGALRGPTKFQAMNLPSLRSQDNQPGIYVAATGVLPGWIGCDLLMSTDGGLTYQSVLTMTARATMGTLAASCTASSEPISVTLYDNAEIETVTPAQITARQNAFAIGSSGVWEVGQVETVTANGSNFDLTDVLRGQLETTAASHAASDPFVMLDEAVYFLPLDVGLAGETVTFRPVSIGTPVENNPTYSFTYDPPTFIIDGGDST